MASLIPKFTGTEGLVKAAAAKRAAVPARVAPAKTISAKAVVEKALPSRTASQARNTNYYDRGPVPPLKPKTPQAPTGSEATSSRLWRQEREQRMRNALLETDADRNKTNPAPRRSTTPTARAVADRAENERRFLARTGHSWAEDYRNPKSPNYGKPPGTRRNQPTATPVRVFLARPSSAESSSGTTSATPVFGATEGFQRSGALFNTAEMSDAEYAALSPRQQAAVQFNTGLAAAARRDHKTGTNSTENTEKFLADMGITPRSEAELNKYLNLDMLISPSTIAKMDDVANAVQQPTSSIGYMGIQPDKDRQAVTDARRNSEMIGRAIATRLSTSGSIRGDSALPGFGTSNKDVAIQELYAAMVDSTTDATPRWITEQIGYANEAGIDVTPQEVWDFAAAQLDAVQFNRLGSKQPEISHPEFNYDGNTFTPREVDDIRTRFGL